MDQRSSIGSTGAKNASVNPWECYLAWGYGSKSMVICQYIYQCYPFIQRSRLYQGESRRHQSQRMFVKQQLHRDEFCCILTFSMINCARAGGASIPTCRWLMDQLGVGVPIHRYLLFSLWRFLNNLTLVEVNWFFIDEIIVIIRFYLPNQKLCGGHINLFIGRSSDLVCVYIISMYWYEHCVWHLPVHLYSIQERVA